MNLADLYERDETAWLEESSRLIAAEDFGKLDFENLVDFLESMANRDKRQVRSRLTLLIAHLLKWQLQPDQRTRSWEQTIDSQRTELRELLSSKTLLRHARECLPDAFQHAVRSAALETALPQTTFPSECPFTIEFLLSDLLGEEAKD